MSEKELDSEKVIGQMLSQVAAQLRCSLVNVHGAINRLAPQDQREADAKIDRNAALLEESYFRLLRLAGNLTDAAVLAGDQPLPLQNEDLVSLCRILCGEAAALAALQEQQLIFHCDEEERLVAVHAQGVERLLLNLLSNAMKFTPKGGTITVELRFENGQVELSVSDTGTGIPPQLLPTLFDRYRHVERTDPAPHGLGLGLPICHHIAKGHDGTLTASSVEGVGTRVTFTFPDRINPVATVQDVGFDYAGGFDHTLLELSDALSAAAFCRRREK